MRKRRLFLLLLLLAMLAALPLRSLAEGTTPLSWTQAPDVLRPGKLMRLTYLTPDSSATDLSVINTAGETVMHLVSTSSGSLTWDGTGVTPGSYILRLTCGGETAEHAVTIGEAAPELTILSAQNTASSGWKVEVWCSMAGTLTLRLEDGQSLVSQGVTEGNCTLVWDGKLNGQWLKNGVQELCLTLTDSTGFTSTAQLVEVLVENPQLAHDAESITPDDLSGVTCDHELCYWKLPMGETDDALVWKVLTQPITVLSGDERKQQKVRREPVEGCTDYVGEVTYESQGVHVIERGEEWSLIEAYSSSVEGSSVAVWAKQFRGYVPTSLLKEVEVSQEYGIVVDKLQQRLYVYQDGARYATLLCSTGYPSSGHPYNETTAGEFLTISWTGGFWSGNLYCDMAIRINDGILLHEVPCTIIQDEYGNEVRDYSRCTTYLGEKASHGCIRIQRELSPEGVNAKWLWENLPRGSSPRAKVIIWDEKGRTLMSADDGVLLYYNPNGGRNYHSDPYCALVNDRFLPMAAFRYGELDEKPYSGLKACPGCAPQLRRSEVEEINAEYADEK